MNNRCELVIPPQVEDVFFRPYIQIHFSDRYIEYLRWNSLMRIPYRTASDARLTVTGTIQGLYSLSGRFLTARSREVSNMRDSDSDFSNCSEIWQAPRRQRYHYNIQSHPWWRHQMETFFALLTLCAENSPVTGEFPSQRPVTRSFDVFFDLRLDKRLSEPSRRRWFETPLRPLWRHCNERPFSHVWGIPC